MPMLAASCFGVDSSLAKMFTAIVVGFSKPSRNFAEYTISKFVEHPKTMFRTEQAQAPTRGEVQGGEGEILVTWL